MKRIGIFPNQINFLKVVKKIPRKNKTIKSMINFKNRNLFKSLSLFKVKIKILISKIYLLVFKEILK